MPETIPDGTMSLILLGISYSFIIPLLLFIIFKKRFRAHAKPFFLGLLAYGAFSFCLVNIVNGLLLMFVDPTGFSTPLIFIYSLCTQIIGVLIGQIGKYYALRILKNDANPNKYAMRGEAMVFGAGYGGLELVLTVGVTMASYFSYATIMVNGQSEAFMENLSGADLASVQSIFDTLANTTSMDYMSLLLQGLAMFLFQLGSSLLVFRAVFGSGANDKAYLRLAIIFHIIMIVPGCFVSAGIISNPWFQTILMLIFSIAVLVYGYDKIKEYEKQHVADMVNAAKGKKTIHFK
ncbi:MAG TPA: YhfC family intramembrane metalloprotease [Candidatus Scybalocola faecavium]|nr:YhfC family intramembrane metalloprotease [Candidatus Scybalocola faecavium]